MTKMPASAHGSILVLVFLMLFNLLVPLEYAEGKQTAYSCEGTTMRLDCDGGKVIHLIRAIYGRFSITICNENGNTEWSVNCGSPKSILVLNGTCNFQKTCEIEANSERFGDPCPGTVKYLEVQYQCIYANSLASTTPRSVAGPKPGPPWLLPPSSVDSGGGGKPTFTFSTSTTSKGLLGSIDIPFKSPGGGGSGSGSKTNVSNNSASGSGGTVVSVVNAGPSTLLPPMFVTTVRPFVLAPNSSSSSSTGIAVLNEPNPLLPPLESEEYEEQREIKNDMNSNVNMNSYGERPGSENEYKSWPGEALDIGDGATESNWGWEAQVEKQKQKESDTGSGFEPMWSDKVNENGVIIRERIPVLVTVTPIPPTHHSDINSFDEANTEGTEKKAHPAGKVKTEYCEARTDRGMFWNWTAVGETAQQPCPGGAAGLARWKCVQNPVRNQPPIWFPESPDLSDCKSAWLMSLQARVNEGDRIGQVASDLAQVTSTKQMYGGDITAAVKIIKTIANRMNVQLRSLTNQVSREDLAAEALQHVLETGSNLLEKTRLDPWRDLSYGDQMAIATQLLVGLEDNSFLLANVVSSEKTLRKSSKNILTTIYAIEANNVREINFPLETKDHWSRTGDVLSMPAEALRENSDGGLVRLVCFAYNNLEHVLQPLQSSEEAKAGTRKLVNSRVISASLNQGRHIQLALPVTLTLRHLWLDNVSNPQCVFWDYTLNAWSEEGCRVIRTNRTHTMCQCTHLTNFAILMDLDPQPQHLPTPQLLQIIMYAGSAVVILCLLFALIITHFCIHGKVFQTMILKNLFISMLVGEIIFVFGIHQTENPYMCTGIAASLHYFALVSILWLFLHGFHLHLIVVEAAESGLSRKLWYYGVSYGSPAIVVLLSFLLDPRSYRSEKHCWIQTSFTLLCFVGPAVVVALATAAVLIYTSYRVCSLLSTMPKKPNDDRALYSYAGTWLQGSLLILVLMAVTWTLRLLDLESNSLPLSYSASLSLALEGIAILVFHSLKSEDTISKVCDCGKKSDTSDTEMSTHSQQQLQGMSSNNVQGIGVIEACRNNHLTQHIMDGSRLLTLGRQPLDLRGHEGIYSKQLGAVVGIHPSPGGFSGHSRYGVDSAGMIGFCNKDGTWTRGSSYSDIRTGSLHRADPVYEEIEKPLSPRASTSDLSEDDGHGLYPHDVEIYTKNICGHQRRMVDHYHHTHSHGTKGRKVEIRQAGEAANPLLNRSQHLVQSHYNTKHRTSTDHHHVSLKGLNRDEHILQNVHMV